MCPEVTWLREVPHAKKEEIRQRSHRVRPVRRVGAHWPKLRKVLALRRDLQNQEPVFGKQLFYAVYICYNDFLFISPWFFAKFALRLT